ncbi:MAG: TetR/AcrR family transcriptional regulator [Micromonosporaceae bacterium]
MSKREAATADPAARPQGGRKQSGRRRLSVVQRRDEIVSATLRLLSTTPASQLSIDDIAEAAGASRALIYHYFRTKERLFASAVRSACDDLQSRLVLPDVHPFEKVQYAARAYLEFAEQRQGDFVALLRGAARTGGEPDELAGLVEQTRQFIVDLVITGIGIERPSAVLRASLRGWVAMMEVISLEWLEHQQLTRDQVRRLIANQLGAVLVAAAAEDEELSAVYARLLATADVDRLPPWVRALARPTGAGA